MEIADGYLLLEQLLLLVLYTQIALLPQEQQLHSAKHGDQLVYQMVQLVFQEQHAHLTQHRLAAEMLVQMELVSGLLQLELQQQGHADFNYVQMPLPTSQLMQDVLYLQLQLLAQPQEQLALHKPHAHNT